MQDVALDDPSATQVVARLEVDDLPVSDQAEAEGSRLQELAVHKERDRPVC